MAGQAQPPDDRRLWAVVLEIRDDGKATRRSLESWVDDEGRRHPGLLEKHDKLQAEVEALQKHAASGGEKRWAVAALAIGAGIGKALDWLIQLAPHTTGKGS